MFKSVLRLPSLPVWNTQTSIFSAHSFRLFTSLNSAPSQSNNFPLFCLDAPSFDISPLPLGDLPPSLENAIVPPTETDALIQCIKRTYQPNVLHKKRTHG